MPRTLPIGLTEVLKSGYAESHSTLELSLPSDIAPAITYYFATARLTIDGVVYDRQLRDTGAVKTSLTRAADRVTVELQNVDTVLGVDMLRVADTLYGANVRFGRYWKDLRSAATFHHILLTGAVAGVEINENVVRLTLISDTYAAVSVGAKEQVIRTCRFQVQGEFRGTNCGYSGAKLTCNGLIDDADGCDGRHGSPLKRAKFGGFVYIEGQNTIAGAAALPVPAYNQLMKLAASDGTVSTTSKQQPFLALHEDTFNVTNDNTNLQTRIAPKGVPTKLFNAVFDYDAVPDGVTNTTTELQAAIDAAEAAGGGTVFLQAGTYKVTGLTINGHVKLAGSSEGEVVIYSTANAPIIDCGQTSFEFPVLENIKIRGDVTAGSSQIGLRVDDATYGLRATVRNVWIENCGGVGLYVGKAFSSYFENVFVTNCAGYPFLINAPNMPGNTFVHCYAGNLRDSAPVGFRVKAGEVLLKSCNGVNSLNPGSKWAVVGMKSGVDGDVTNGSAILDLEDCNLESYIDSGIYVYYSSLVNLRGNTTFVGQLQTTQLDGAINNAVTTITVDSTQYFSDSGTLEIDSERITYTGKTSTTFTGCTRGAEGTSAASHSDNATVKLLKKPIVWEHINEGTDYFAHTLVRGIIEDSVRFTDGGLSNYVRNEAIHANGFPPFQTVGRGARVVSGDPLQTYWNSVTGASAKLSRADSYLSKLTITGTTSITQPGYKYIEVNHSAPTTLTLAWPALYTLGDLVIVKDVSSGGAATNNITINANGGGTVNGSSFVMNINGQAVILAPDGSNDWRIVATYSPGGSGITGSGANTRLTYWNGASSVTSDADLTYDGFNLTSGRIYHSGGSGGAPGVGPAGDTGTGMYQATAGTYSVAVSAGATGERVRFQANGINLLSGRVTWDASETIFDLFGSGSPEGSVTASIGSVYRRSNGSSGTTLYIKESGTGNTGWVAVNPSGGGSGTVNTGAANALAYYPSSGTTVDDASGLSHSPGASPNFTVTAQNSAHVPLLLQLVASQSANALEIKNSGGSTVFNLTPSGGFTAAGDSIFSLTGSSTGSPRKLQLTNIGSGTAFRMELESEGTGFQAREAGKLQIQARYGVKIVGTRNSTFAPSFESGATTDPALYLENGVTGAIPLRVNAISSTSTNLAEFQSSASTVFSLTTAGVLGVVAASDPGSPTNSDLWRSSSRNAISIRNSGQTEDLSGSMWRSSASVFFDTTTTETSIISDTGVGTKTLAADRLKAGSHIRIKASGFYGTKATSPGTFTIKLKNGATTMLTIAAFTLPTNVADQNWWIEATGALNATGSSGTINWTITFHYNDGTGDLKTRTYTVNSTTINTTTTNALNITGQFSVSDAANFWQTDAACIEIF